MYIIIKL